MEQYGLRRQATSDVEGTTTMLRKKKTFADEAREWAEDARDWAEDVVETMRPHVESAREAMDDFVHDRAVPALQDARDNAQPYIAAGAASLAEHAEHAAEVAQERADQLADQVAEAAGRPRKKKRSKFKIALVVGAVGGAAAYAAKKFGGSSSAAQDAWTPPTPPAPVQSSPGAPPTDMAEESLGEEAQDKGSEAKDGQKPDPLSDPIPPEDKP
ncbi:hypothetical protein KUV85_12950 [Nocardioides panacisoli]|uniref:hypothetical protein n=1 Tax=Nocardioides panacisoli TaxID=627624 RepID=UPI001C637059|nr:hypothetical protein [Nocardioides panacisoli]QYJ03238.1 hypothetical protein KUV85_12950 [Nocardioides panacisoli]